MQTRSIAAPFAPDFHIGLSGLASSFRRWSERQRTAAELSALSDRELADIGVARSDIADVAAGSVTR